MSQIPGAFAPQLLGHGPMGPPQHLGFAPMVSGQPYVPTTGMEGLPFANQGMLGMALQMGVIQPWLQQASARYGMMPLGLTDRNAYDSLERLRFTQMHEDLLRKAAGRDTEGFMQSFRGLAAISDTPFGPEQRRGARALTDMMGAFAPIVAQIMPTWLDDMAGVRGSATVMTHHMNLAGRYRLDPVTGRMGMSAASMEQISGQVFDDLFGGDRYRERQGMRAGDAGQLFDELSRRGRIAGPTGSRREQLIRAAADLDDDAFQAAAERQGVPLPARRKDGAFDFSRMSMGDLESLKSDPAIAERMRNFQAQSAVSTIKNYTSVISALRDIFGDAGRPDAPIAELMAGLEQLTQGASAQLSPQRLGQIVRQTHSLSQQTGLPMETLLGLQQHGAVLSQQRGLDPLFGIQAAQGAAGFAAAWGGLGYGENVAWGRLGQSELTQADLNLRVGAADSELTNQLAVLSRLRNVFGGFEKGSRAEAYIQAARAHQTEFTYTDEAGKQVTESVAMNEGDFVQMLTEARGVAGPGEKQGRNLGIRASDVQRMIGQRFDNQEESEKWNYMTTSRRSQKEAEIVPFIAERAQETIEGQLTSRGMSAEAARKVAMGISEKLAREGFEMSDKERANPELRQNRFTRVIEEGFKGTEAETLLNAQGIRLNDAARLTADQFYGRTNRALSESQFSGTVPNLQRAYQLFDDETLAGEERQQFQARVAGIHREAFAGVGRGGMLRRAVSYLQEAREGESDVKELALTMFGGIPFEKLNKDVQVALQGLLNESEKIQTQIDDANLIQDPIKRQEAIDALEIQKAAVQAEVQKTYAAGEQAGYLMDSPLSDADLAMASRSQRKFGSLLEAAKADQTPWADYWKSDKGKELREAAGYAMEDVESLASRALSSKPVTEKLGAEGLEHYRKVREAGQDLRELARQYTGGDVERILAEDIGIDKESEEGQEALRKIREARAAQAAATEFYKTSLSGDFKGTALTDAQWEEVAGLQRSVEMPQSDLDSLLRSLYRLYGIEEEYERGAKGGDREQLLQIAGEGHTPEFLQRAVQTQESLLGFAKKAGYAPGTAGVDKLRREYLKAVQDGDVAGFQSAHKMSDEEFASFRDAMQFQEATDFSRFGASTDLESQRDIRPQDRIEFFRNLERGAPQAETKEPGGLSQTEIKGTLTIVGDQGKVNGTISYRDPKGAY